MAVIQISRIQVRTGRARDLPDNLAEGEFGMTTDTGEVFIGAPGFSAIQGRAATINNPGVYPYRNIKILTEFDLQHNILDNIFIQGPIHYCDIIGPNLDNEENPIPLMTLWPNMPIGEDSGFNFRFGIFDYSITKVLSDIQDTVDYTMGTLMVAVDDENMSFARIKDTRITDTDTTGVTFGVVNGPKVSGQGYDSGGQPQGGTYWNLFVNNSSGNDYRVKISGRTWNDTVWID